MTNLPLAGIRVLEHTDYLAGPYCAMVLADLGAEVISVESITRVSQGRGMIRAFPQPSYPLSDPGEHPWNRMAGLAFLRRNKLSLTLDIATPKGRDIYLRLTAKSDVVINGMAGGVMERLGLGNEDLKAVNPDIIVITLASFGDTGPYRDWTGTGNTVNAITGHNSLEGYKGESRDQASAHVWPDNVGGVHALFAMLTALHYRQRTGKGQFIDLAQTEGFMPHMADVIADYVLNGRVAEPMGNDDPVLFQGCYRCRGADNWVVVAITNDEEWATLCQLLRRPQWAEDPRFASNELRRQNRAEIDAALSRWTAGNSDYQAMNILQRAGVPAGVVLSNAQALSDFQLISREYFETVPHPEAGSFPLPGQTWKLSKTPTRIVRPAPTLGQHNHYVFGGVLGMSQEEIAQLEAEKLIGTVPLPGADGI